MKARYLVGTISLAAAWLACRTTSGPTAGTLVKDDAATSASADDTSSAYGDIWARVKAAPYAAGTLPHDDVTLASFGLFAADFVKNAVRTLTSQSDWLPTFRKLLRPNGICLAGTWTITAETPFTGYFAKGAQGLIIARASVNFNQTDAGQVRSFGMAGKLYPTSDPSDQTPFTTANFFVIDDNSGTTAASYLDVALLNEPKVSANTFAITHAAVLAATKTGQEDAEFKVTHLLGHSGIRQLYRIAALGTSLSDGDAAASSPRHLRISGATTDAFRTGAVDFRDELLPGSYAIQSGLSFGIAVDGLPSDRADAQGFTTIGQIKFTDAVASEGCDHNLHFAHPKWLSN